MAIPLQKWVTCSITLMRAQMRSSAYVCPEIILRINEKPQRRFSQNVGKKYMYNLRILLFCSALPAGAEWDKVLWTQNIHKEGWEIQMHINRNFFKRNRLMGLWPHVKTSHVLQSGTQIGSTSQELITLTAEDTTYLTIQEAVKYWHKETLERIESSQLLGKYFHRKNWGLSFHLVSSWA